MRTYPLNFGAKLLVKTPDDETGNKTQQKLLCLSGQCGIGQARRYETRDTLESDLFFPNPRDHRQIALVTAEDWMGLRRAWNAILAQNSLPQNTWDFVGGWNKSVKAEKRPLPSFTRFARKFLADATVIELKPTRGKQPAADKMASQLQKRVKEALFSENRPYWTQIFSKDGWKVNRVEHDGTLARMMDYVNTTSLEAFKERFNPEFMHRQLKDMLGNDQLRSYFDRHNRMSLKYYKVPMIAIDDEAVQKQYAQAMAHYVASQFEILKHPEVAPEDIKNRLLLSLGVPEAALANTKMREPWEGNWHKQGKAEIRRGKELNAVFTLDSMLNKNNWFRVIGSPGVSLMSMAHALTYGLIPENKPAP